MRTISLTFLLFLSTAYLGSCSAAEGAPGAEGATGATGAAGKAGAAGSKGATGGVGAAGAAGTMGTMGTTGVAGEAGPAGPVGLPGASASSPSGTIVGFVGLSTSVPAGWALCDGSAVSRTSATYGGLFGIIGTYWGGGDMVNTYNLPDLRGRFVRGTDNAANHDPNAGNRSPSLPGAASGDNPGSLETWGTALPAVPFTTDVQGSHTHSATGWSWYSTGASPLGEIGGANQAFEPITLSTAGAHSHTVVGGGDDETRPSNIGMNYIIKL